MIRKLATLTSIILMTCSAAAAEAPQSSVDLKLMQGAPPPAGRLVTKENAWDAPFNRWTFQNMRALYPSVGIDRGSGPVQPFPQAPVALDKLPIKGMDGQDATIEKVLRDDLYTDGIVVLQHGRIVYERYWNGMTPKSVHWSMSVGKTITGTLAGILIDRGQIDPERLVSDYIPELKDSGFGNATVNQVLDMLVDIEMDESPAALANPKSPYNMYLGAQGFRPMGEPSSAYRYLPTMKAKGPPGQFYHYVTPNTDVIGWLVERVSGKSFVQLFSDEIWSKVGGESDAYYLIDPEGHALAAGGFNSSTRDLARWGQVMLQEGIFGDVRVFPSSVVKDIRENGSKEMWAKGGMDALIKGGSQRKYWYKTNNADGSFLGVGVFGNHLYINPAAGVVIAKHASFPVSSTQQLQQTAIRVMESIAEHITAK